MKRFVLTAVLFALLPMAIADAGSVTFQVAQGGQTTASKTYTLTDAEVGRMIAAFQSDANVSVNGTATRAQVLAYAVDQMMQMVVSKVQQIEGDAIAKAVAAPTPLKPQ